MTYDKLSYACRLAAGDKHVGCLQHRAVAVVGIKRFRGAIRIIIPDRVFGI